MKSDLASRMITVIVLAAMAGVVAVVVFGVPTRALLTAAAVLVCPLSMLLMHGGHGAHGGSRDHSEHHDAARDR